MNKLKLTKPVYTCAGATSKKHKIAQDDSFQIIKEQEVQTYYKYQQPSTKIVIPIRGEIKDAAYYTDIIERLNGLTEEDQVNVIFNSHGGDVSGAMALISALQNTPAVVTGVVEGACHSAASIILQYCDGVAVGKYANMLCHVWTAGDGGKAPDFHSSYTFNREFLKNFLEESYEGFLTEDEMKELLSGKDFWFTGDEIAERCKNRFEYFQSMEESLEDEESCEDCCSCEENTSKEEPLSEESDFEYEDNLFDFPEEEKP